MCPVISGTALGHRENLTSITDAKGHTTTFKYDPFGRRIYKSSSAGTSIFAYDGDNLIEEVNASGAVVARYTQGQNIDEPLAMSRSGVTSYYEADGLGSVTSLTSGSGALAQTYTFDSFGKQIASNGSLTNPFQYTAREFDTETGLYYHRARYYDAAIGRFLSEDPVRFAASPNFYSYVRNSSPNYGDESGYGPGFNWWSLPFWPTIGPELVGYWGARKLCLDFGLCSPPPLVPPSGVGGCPVNIDDCDLQRENDWSVCRMLPDRRARARCWRSAAERYQNCRHGVYIPPLVTDPDE
jgi:RHS repeat-associated protein